jgi:hypothetical protein
MPGNTKATSSADRAIIQIAIMQIAQGIEIKGKTPEALCKVLHVYFGVRHHFAQVCMDNLDCCSEECLTR